MSRLGVEDSTEIGGPYDDGVCVHDGPDLQAPIASGNALPGVTELHYTQVGLVVSGQAKLVL